MDTNKEVRKSTRENFGKAPDRYGWEETFSTPITDVKPRESRRTPCDIDSAERKSIVGENGTELENVKDLQEPMTLGNDKVTPSLVQTEPPYRSCDVSVVSQATIKNNVGVNNEFQNKKKTNSIASKASSQTRKLAEIRLRALDEERKLLEREVELEKTKIENEKILVKKRLAIEFDLINSCDGSEDDSDEPGDGGNSQTSERNKHVLKWIDDVEQPERKNTSVNENNAENRKNGNDNQPEDALMKFAKTICDGLKNISSNPGHKTLKDKELPAFHGNAEEWPIFEIAYKRLNKIYKYSDEENLILLQKCLKGNALDTVRPLLVSEKNLETILDTLKTTYGKPDVIMESLIEKAKTFNAMREEDLLSLQKFSTLVQNIAVTAESLNVEAYNANPSVVKELLIKLTPNLRYQWAKFLKEKNIRVPTLSNFASWIKDETETLSYYLGKTAKDCRSRNVNVVATTVTGNEATRKCIYCNEEHSIYHCKQFKQLEVDSRWKWITQQKLCFCCIRGRHPVKRCPNKRKCGKIGCDKYHNSLLHTTTTRVDNDKIESAAVTENRREEAPGPVVTAKASAVQPKNSIVKANTNFIQNRTIFMKILPVTIYYRAKSVNVYAFLDEGSDSTLMDADFALENGLRGICQALELTLTGEQKCIETFSETLQLSISAMGSDIKYPLSNVRTVRNLRLGTQSIDMEKWRRKWPHLMEVPAESYHNANPKLLIGLDNNDLLIPLQVVRGESKNSPAAVETKLGWTVYGKFSHFSNYKSNHNFYISTMREDQEWDEMFSKFIESERFGISSNEKFELKDEQTKNSKTNIQCNDDIRKAEKIMKETCRFDEVTRKWEIGLLWKEEGAIMPDNKNLALKRFRNIEKDLNRDPNLAKQYAQQIDDYELKGYAQRLTDEEAQRTTTKTWYLPHFSVKNPNKPEKFRFVFDAKSRFKGVSFNDHLLTGPDLLNELPAILYKFRQGRIGFAGDIAEMFLRIQIREEDRDAQRFLWKKPGTVAQECELQTYRMSSMIFGSVCSPSCAIYVTRKNAEKYEAEFPDAAEAIRRYHYMDDYADSRNTPQEASKQIQDVITVHEKGGFVMRNWVTNSEEVKEMIPSALRKDTEMEKVLGICWNVKNDTLQVHVGLSKISQILNAEQSPTKREVLKVVMAVYDPMGILAPIVIRGKILLQELWKGNMKWDDDVTGRLLNEYKEFAAAIKDVKKIEVPRCYSVYLETTIHFQLHTFCDASEKAFAAVVYFRIETSTGQTSTAFVSAKTRVASIKKKKEKFDKLHNINDELTIPKLELQAAKLGAELSLTVIKNHTVPIKASYFWTDSTIALAWIGSKKRDKLPVFIRNRVCSINEITDLKDWNWVPTESNAADIATRGNYTISSLKDSSWLTGPEFLLLPKNSWPKSKTKKEEIEAAFTAKISSTTLENAEQKRPIIDITRFSNYLRLLRMTAWVFRYVRNLRQKVKQRRDKKDDRKSSEQEFEELNVSEVTYAENFLIKLAQQDSFEEEIKSLENGKFITAKSKIYGLSPILENGILKVSGRLLYCQEIPEDTKKPIILDSKSALTKLILQHYHQRNHQGTDTVLCQLRQKFWIIGAKTALKQIRRKCVGCRTRLAKPKIPQMAPLPEYRLCKRSRPFSFSGLDYFGPLFVTIGRRREKRYGALFTCFQTRAIHLEMANSLTTDSAIMAIHRMSCRRGPPEKIFSDNGSNFHGAEAELLRALEELDQERIKQFCTTQGTEWHFNPPRAPHFGGVWERLVKSVKDALKAILKEQAPKEEVLLTLFSEVEWTVNSRPLTAISDDPSDEECLTPNHFLIGTCFAPSPYGEFDDDDLLLRKNWRIAQRYADMYWKRWTQEYLITLNKRPKWLKGDVAVKVGDLVLLVDENAPRNVWPKGIVMKVYPGKDEKVRVVEVKTAYGLYKRPVSKVIIIRPAENVPEKVPE